MRRLYVIMTILALCSFAVAANSADTKTASPASRIHGVQPQEASKSYEPAQVRAGNRQSVLFVEDNGGNFGPPTFPDPLWTATLNNVVGSGNYSWVQTTSQTQDGPSLSTMQAYTLVIWNCYDVWWSGPGALTANDQTNIASYLSGGGKVWLIGQDLIYSGVPASWLQTNFNLLSYIEDYNYNIYTATVQGLSELAGLNATFTADYTSNPFFCDNLTPNANAHHVILDVGYTAYPAIFNNNHAASFWTIDGRTPNPVATWEQMVYNMLQAFGVFAAYSHDVGVSSILVPTGTYTLNAVVTPSAQVRNFGLNDETFPVIFNIERNSVLVYADTVTISVDSGEVDTAVFNQFTFTQSGTYDIECHTELVGDENPANDTAFATVNVFQWAEDFEATNGGFVADPSAGAWEWGVPTSGPMAAHSGTKLWATVLAGAYYDNANWKLSSGIFAATENNPHLYFYNWYDIETTWDGGNVKYSTDNGTTWSLLHPVGGYDGVASTYNVGIPAESCFTGHPAAWTLEEIIVPVTSGQTFQIRFHFGTDGSVTYPGWYIDDLAGVGLVGVEENVTRIPSGVYALFAATPNPMTHSTRITFNMPHAAKATLRVYDIQGRLVATLLHDTELPAGMNDVVWRGTDMDSRQLPAGIYFYELKTPDYRSTEKLIITH